MWAIVKNDGTLTDVKKAYLEAKYLSDRLTDQQTDSRVWFMLKPYCAHCGSIDGFDAITGDCVNIGNHKGQ